MDSSTVIFISTLLGFILMLWGGFFYAGLYGVRLYSYLKKNNYIRWRELTSFGKYGPGYSNPFRGFRYIYDKTDNENESILRMKDAVRIGFRYCILAFGAIIVNIVIIFLLID